jgi:uncharacterized cupredoxin-like copper-binding protein
MVTTLLVVSGCASSGRTAKPAATVVPITERDFKISAPRHDLAAGRVDFAVSNRGPDAHEFIVVREIDTALPMRSDGLTVSEEALEHYEAGSLEPGEPGHVRNLEVNLTPGRYVLLCNMSGHFMGGMHTQVEVH